jgi:hypothetical protein
MKSLSLTAAGTAAKTLPWKLRMLPLMTKTMTAVPQMMRTKHWLQGTSQASHVIAVYGALTLDLRTAACARAACTGSQSSQHVNLKSAATQECCATHTIGLRSVSTATVPLPAGKPVCSSSRHLQQQQQQAQQPGAGAEAVAGVEQQLQDSRGRQQAGTNCQHLCWRR